MADTRPRVSDKDGAGDVPAPSLVTIISVTYNSVEKTRQMLASVPAQTPVFVVDNGSDDVRALADLCAQHGAHLIRNAENRGFGPACNQGAALADTPFLLFLNPDALLLPGALDELVAAARRTPQFGAMNPRLQNPDGSPYLKRKSPLIPRSEWMPRGWPQVDQPVTTLSGCAFFTRRDAFAQVGGFDPAIFLYHEDDDLAQRLRQQVGPLMFVRDAGVVHASGSSTARTPQVAALKAWHMGRSRVYVARKHGRPFAVTAALGRALVQMLSPEMLLSARKRSKHAAFLRGVLSQIGGPSVISPSAPDQGDPA